MRINVEEITEVKEVSAGEIKFFIEEPRRIITAYEDEQEPIPAPEPQPIAISFSASSSEITEGDTVTLTWSVQNATSVTLNGSTVASSGSTEVSPTASQDYVLEASNEQYSDSETISVVVNPVILPVSLTFEASATEINEGESLTLTWTTENAEIVTLNGSPVEANGSLEVTPEQSQDYTLTASNAEYEDSSTISIVVNALPTYQQKTIDYMTSIGIPDNDEPYTDGITNRQVWNLVDQAWKHIVDNGEAANVESFHPMIGGTADKHGYNYLNVNQYYGTFYGDWIIDKTGNKTNGVNTYMSFGVVPFAVAGANDNIGMGIAQLEAPESGDDGFSMGSISVGSKRTYFMGRRTSDGASRWSIGSNSSENFYVDSGVGCFASYYVDGLAASYKEQEKVYETYGSSDISEIEIYYGAVSNSGSPLYSLKKYGSCFVFRGNENTCKVINQASRMLEEGLNRLQNESI